jgi:hypothetical protein
MIPDKILNLRYSKHSIQERIREERGLIHHVPINFIKAGCKQAEETDKGFLKVTYIYDDKNDLVLIIQPDLGLVITNYLNYADNKGVYKGRFFIQATHKNATKNLRR